MQNFWCIIFFNYIIIFSHIIYNVQCKATDPEAVSLITKTKFRQRISENNFEEEIDVPEEERDWSNIIEAVWHLLPNIKGVCSNRTLDCDASRKYRTMDGTCNNLDYPRIGSSAESFSRLLPAEYSDGVNEPRGGRKNSSLPNARLVTTTVHGDLVHTDLPNNTTNLIPIFGLFLENDLSFTLIKDKPCCSGDPDIDCWPIQIYQNDSFFSSRGQTCKDFTRSTAYCHSGADGVRKQFNRQTAYLDLSNVYGSDDKQLRYLRTTAWPAFFRRWEVEKEQNVRINRQENFSSGDKRANTLPSLYLMHILFLLEHNDTASRLLFKNPHWNEERVFQETRRIVIAEYQNIIYNEYLPAVLDSRTMDYFNLSLHDGSSSSYIKNIDPSISNAFAIAANRFGDALINPIREFYFDFQILESDERPREGYGLRFSEFIQRKPQFYGAFENSIFDSFSGFEDKMKDFVSDLIDKNIQRGRDHGIPGYSKFRQLCNLAPLTTWENRPVEIRPDTWKLFSELYASPKDIDLFSAGISEIHNKEAVVGPTFACLLGIQFSSAKFGDRFFFTHGNQSGSFTEKQRETLRRRTLRDLMCSFSFRPGASVLLNVFRTPSLKNFHLTCNSVNELDLDYWRELPNV